MKLLIAACAIFAIVLALGCPSKKAEKAEQPKPAVVESTLTAPAPVPTESIAQPAPAPTPAPQPKPETPSGKPPKVGR